MALHGLAHAVVGVPDVDANRTFYREFGLIEGPNGRFSSADGGEQLRLVHAPVRQLVEPRSRSTTRTTSPASGGRRRPSTYP